MSEDRPQLYLATPPSFDLEVFPQLLARVLGAQEIACLRLGLATKDEDKVMRAADAVRQVAHEFDVALVIENHIALVERHGLDGVHLTDGARTVRYARKELGQEAIVGCFCAASQHDGMTAGEAGADYVCFGPVGETGLGTGARAERDLFQWWSEVIEVPVVAEGALTEALVRDFAPVTDFFAVGEEIWTAEDPVAALGRLVAAMG
ncbi:thiamine phosphate synthase [Rhodobacter capsulatus]|uniref:thiamine phosphate synthase n=1 Tax=Rhodobacter capsulatus TaxID=1061 RepID=UPI0006DCED3F|nr:thiamine phosphate synthase [Rhodobacter capsulatus]KQB17327.1 thiamine-phosphate pyrophosphorylase [Rhodobacter capsulatus]KQB17729.1 thiamine-phosphate pyrophosphorylase [Rhodobacter capsulatus]PZX27262.1 thiamine-phosphate pyrophosphorylase [Rhodobacter capsulatus]QNR64354.1 thiamine phosphate synthase [Rhodobacter capsulatus]